MKIRVNTICPGCFPTDMTGKQTSEGSIELHPDARRAAERSTAGTLSISPYIPIDGRKSEG